MRSNLLNLVVVIMTLFCIAVLGEVTVRVLQHYEYLPHYGKPLTKAIAEKRRETNSSHVKYLKSENPILFVEYDPADPRVNELGMRGPVPALTKDRNVYRIAVLGDSVAFGYGLRDADSFPRQLELLLNQQSMTKNTSPVRTYEIINFAVSGYGLEAYPEVYKAKVRAFKPDLVILAYVLNDPYSIKALFRVLDVTLKQEMNLKRVGKVSQLAAWLFDTSQRALDNYKNTKQFNEMYSASESQGVIDEKLALLQREVSSDTGTLVTFVFPYFYDMSNYPLENIHAVIGASLQRAGIQYHDLLSDYRSHDVLALRLEPGDYTHPNVEGQRIAAEAMEHYLKKQKIL